MLVKDVVIAAIREAGYPNFNIESDLRCHNQMEIPPDVLHKGWSMGQLFAKKPILTFEEWFHACIEYDSNWTTYFSKHRISFPKNKESI